MDGGWLTPRPGRFTPGKETQYWLYGRLGGHQGRSDGCGKYHPHRNFFLYSLVLCTSSVLVSLSGFEPATPASERPQTLALDRAATGIGIRSPGSLAPSASPYRLSYRGPSPRNGTWHEVTYAAHTNSHVCWKSRQKAQLEEKRDYWGSNKTKTSVCVSTVQELGEGRPVL